MTNIGGLGLDFPSRHGAKPLVSIKVLRVLIIHLVFRTRDDDSNNENQNTPLPFNCRF